MMRTSYPGKLFIMGEYAALESGHRSIVSSVERYLHVDLERAGDWSIKSSFGSVTGCDVFSMTHMPEVSASLITVEKYLGRPLSPAIIRITSELDEGEKKYGFGSSGVVIVAIVSAILKEESVSLSKEELFKLCVLVQREMTVFSSGGDLAASIYHDVIVYTRYDYQWLKKQNGTYKELVEQEWPLLEITTLTLGDIATLQIGWTQDSNKTINYTRAVKEKASDDPMTYRAFLVSSQIFVDDFIRSVEMKDYESLKKAIKMYRRLMNELGNWAQIEIETDALTRLIDTSLNLELAAKVSGSGGGDCGISFVPINETKKIKRLSQTWLEQGIIMIEEVGA